MGGGRSRIAAPSPTQHGSRNPDLANHSDRGVVWGSRRRQRLLAASSPRCERMEVPMIMRAIRFLGALALVAVGAVHLQQYLGADFRAIPTIGPLFLLNAVGAGIVALGLLVPVERVFAERREDAVVGVLATAAVLIWTCPGLRDTGFVC